MSLFISPDTTTFFFQDFYSKVVEPVNDIKGYRLIKTKEGYSLEAKTESCFFYYLERIFKFSNVYSLEEHLSAFYKLASPIMRQAHTSENGYELLACTKTCLVIQQMLRDIHSRSYETAKERDAWNEKFSNLAEETLKAAAAALGVSPLALASLNKMDFIAIQLMKKGAPLEEAQDHATYLLQLASANELKLSIIFSLVELGADMHAAKFPLDTYLKYALRQEHQRAACIIIEAGAEINKTANGFLPFHEACRRGLIEIVRCMISKNVHLTECDSQGNTPLHTACVARQMMVAKILCPLVDCTRKNDAQRTPFGVLSTSEVSYLPFSELEKAFLLQDIHLAKKAASSATYADLLSQLESLSKNYPKSPLGEIEFCYLGISSSHYEKGCKIAKVPTAPDNIKLTMLLAMFDEINFSDTTAADFRDPAPVYKQTQTTSVQEMRQHLTTFINRIEGRVAFLGTPDAGSEAIEQFYLTIENAVKHCIAILQGSRTREMKRLQDSVVLEYVQAAPHCGGRYYNVAVKQFLRVYVGKTPTFEDEVYQLLADFREVLFHAGINQSAHDVHDYNYIVKRLGKKYGLPGWQSMAGFDDPYGGVNTRQAEAKFLSLYTPMAIIKEWIEQRLKDNGEFREQLIDWQKAHVPAGWQKEHFDEISNHIVLLEKNKEPMKKIVEYLSSKDIYVAPGQTPLQAIQHERQYAYLGSQVFDMETGKVKTLAIVHLLVQLEVVTSMYKQPTYKGDFYTVVGGWVNQLTKSFAGLFMRS
jgi:ankyrin repeat protein